MSLIVPQCCIYALIDPRTGEVRYIGQTARGVSRILWHAKQYALRKPSYKVNWIQSLHAEGINYLYAVLEEVEFQKLAEREISWIAHGRSIGWRLTNKTDGGPGTFGFRHEPTTRWVMSVERRNVPHGREWMAKSAASRRTTRHSAETIKKITTARAGISMKGKKHRVQIEEVTSGHRFRSMRAAARACGLSVSSIRWILKGGQTYSGLTFREV